jgi:hypothetical protein
MPQPKEMPTTLQGIEEFILASLDEALGMELGLSEDDSDYDLNFITSKLAKVSVYQEKLSDMMLRLTRVGLEINRVATTKASALKFRDSKLRNTTEYKNTPSALRGEWLSNQLDDARKDSEQWTLLKSAVSSVKDAVAERASTMKRLDSDLRLQTRLLEARIAAGASSPYSFPGNGTDDIELT